MLAKLHACTFYRKVVSSGKFFHGEGRNDRHGRLHVVIGIVAAALLSLSLLAADAPVVHTGALVTAGGPYTTLLIGLNPTDTLVTVPTVDCTISPAGHLDIPAHGMGIRYDIQRDRCGSSLPIALLDVTTTATVSTRLAFNDGLTGSSYTIPLLETKLDDFTKVSILTPVVNDPEHGELGYLVVWNRSRVPGTLSVIPLDGAGNEGEPMLLDVSPGLNFRPLPLTIIGGLRLQQTTVLISPRPSPVVLQGFVVWGKGYGSNYIVPF